MAVLQSAATGALLLALAIASQFVALTYGAGGAQPPKVNPADVPEKDRARLKIIDRVPVVRLTGTPFEMGRQHGALLKRQIRFLYEEYFEALGELPGIEFMPEAAYGRSTRWLTCMTVDPATFGTDREQIRLALEAENIEARPVWKPMHLQPVFRDCRVRGGEVSAGLFERGLCLPSGSNLTDEDRERVINVVRRLHK